MMNTEIQLCLIIKVLFYLYLEKNRKGDCVLVYQRATGGKYGFDGGAAAVATAGGVDPFFFLSAIAEPDPNHLFLHVKLVSNHGDLLRGRFLVLLEEGKEAKDSLSALEVQCTYNNHILLAPYLNAQMLAEMFDNPELFLFLTSRKLFSKATRMLVSMLVLFFRLRLIPSMPMPGDPRALGLDRAWSDVRFSAQTAPTKKKEMEVKTM